MTDQPEPVHGCTIGGQPAMPILISEYNQLVADLAQAQAAADRVRALHRPASDWSWQTFGCGHDDRHEQVCAYCRACHPCPTLTALNPTEDPAP
jgi:hypothetical protein